MISISDNISVGELVYVWFSPFKETQSKSKKPHEAEYRMAENSDKWLKLTSPDGSYSVIFDKNMKETWFGNIRKAKAYAIHKYTM